MPSEYPQLTPEQTAAIAANGGRPIQMEDPGTHKIYVLLEQAPDSLLDEDYVQRELSKGLAAIERGEVREWNPDWIKQEGRRRIDARKASS